MPRNIGNSNKDKFSYKNKSSRKKRTIIDFCGEHESENENESTKETKNQERLHEGQKQTNKNTQNTHTQSYGVTVEGPCNADALSLSTAQCNASLT